MVLRVNFHSVIIFFLNFHFFLRQHHFSQPIGGDSLLNCRIIAHLALRKDEFGWWGAGARLLVWRRNSGLVHLALVCAFGSDSSSIIKFLLLSILSDVCVATDR